MLKFITILSMVALAVACDAIPAALVGPATSAPRATGSEQDFWKACDERETAIGEWQKDRGETVAYDFADGKITFLRAAIEVERIEEEADAKRQKLRDNCAAKAEREFS